jgi:DNA-binding MarR family transcriptional regulator
VRSSLAQLQLTWSLYRELGRPSNLAEALERQLTAVVGNVDRLADLPPFTITVPTQRRE